MQTIGFNYRKVRFILDYDKKQLLQIEILTNNRMRGLSADQSCDFSKYFQTDDKSSLYNYSSSYNNQTLLLQTTQIHKNKHAQPRHTNILQSSHHQTNRSRSLLEDLYEQLEVTIEKSSVANNAQETRKQGLSDIYTMCRHLIGTLKKLENKVERIEENDSKGKNSQKQSPWIESKKQIQSILTYSSLKSSKDSKGCHCQSEKGSNNFMNNLLEYVEYKSKLEIYKDENEQLKKNIVQLEVNSQEMKKQMKKLQGQNLKIKELLKQYQHFNKKQLPKQQFNLQEQISDKRINHIRSNTFEHQPNSPRFKPTFKLHKDEGKQNIKHILQCKIKEEQHKDYYKQSPMTPNPLLRANTTIQFTQNKSNAEVQWKSNKGRFQALSERVQRFLDLDNQKTHSKSKDRILPIKEKISHNNHFQQNQRTKLYYPLEQMLQQDTYQITQQPSKQFLPSQRSTFSELNCIKSLNKTKYCSPERIVSNGVSMRKK